MLAALLASSAFVAGARFRARQDFVAPPLDVSVQANALLKLTPELAPVPLESSSLGKSDSQYRDLMESVLKLLKRHYVEKITRVEETKMARGAIRGMLGSINDPDTRYVDTEERRLLDDAAGGRFHGIGAVLALRQEKKAEMEIRKITVVAPMPGSPAEAAGLKPGNAITKIDGKWIITHNPFDEPSLETIRKAVRNDELSRLSYKKALEAAQAKLKNGLSISDALQKLTTKTSGQLSLTIEQSERKPPLQTKVRCRDTIVDAVTVRTLSKKIAYIRISQFSRQTAKKLAAALAKARAEGTKGIVLDLRNNPGGLLDAATEVEAEFTGGGVLVTIREPKRRHSIRVTKTRAIPLPVVVLVNGGTASVAELVAGTLKETGVATLVGTKTFGDGLIQTPLRLKDGSWALITTGKMLTPGGLDFTATGVVPDIEVADEDGRTDAQLAEAERILLSKLRQG